MHALHIFTFAIAVFLFVDALPHEQPKVHTIPLRAKSTIRRRAYKSDSVSRRALENIALNQDPPDVAYFGKIIFGTGIPQDFDVQFDTGSSDLFIIGEECDSPACNKKPKYNSYLDDTFKNVDNRPPFHVEYADDTFAKGSPATTTIEIGSLSVSTQDFGLVDKISDDFADYTFSGIMGMGLSSASENNQVTPITRLINDKAIDQPQFSFMLGRDADKSPSELTIGGSNTARYNTDLLTWTNLANNNQGNWLIPLDNCFVNDQPLNFQDRTGLIDTGTTRIILPHGDAETFYGKIPNSKAQSDGTYLIPCDTNIVIGLRFSGKTWNMDSRDFVIKGNDICIGSVQGGDTGSDTEWHIGTAFLKNVYTIFDQGDFRVGFSSLKQS